MLELNAKLGDCQTYLITVAPVFEQYQTYVMYVMLLKVIYISEMNWKLEN